MKERQSPVLRLLMIASIFAGVVALAAPVVQADDEPEAFRVIARGLDNPRGMAFDRNGALYVTEAGRGGSGACVEGREGDQVCYGATGAVMRVVGGRQERIVTGLPSLAGEDGSAATGPQDISLLSDGTAFVVVGLGANPDARAQFGAAGAELGRIVRIPTIGARQTVVDVAAYEKTNNPDAGDPAQGGIDSNPYSLISLRDRHVVADAGANALLEVASNGAIRTLAVFNEMRTAPAPPFLGLPPGTQIPYQSVPNAVAIGPDGAYYVGELTGFPFPTGAARVYRIVPGSTTPQVYATNFTNIIDLTFGADGSLYVLEHARNGLLQAGAPGGDLTGRLVRIAPDATPANGNDNARTTVASDGLIFPTSVAISPDGGIYVTSNGIFPGQGLVVRVDACESGTANCPAAAPLVATLSGANEVSNSGVPNQGDPDGSGSAIVTLNLNTNQVCIQAIVANIEPPTRAHIHRGAAGTNGPIVVPFDTLISGNTISGCVAADPALITEIQANPGGFYVNVHNAPYPGGAVRGQLAEGDLSPFSRVFVPLGLR